MKPLLLSGLLICLAFLFQDPVPGDDPPGPADEAALQAVFAQAGLRLDRGAGLLAVPCHVGIKHDLLEYLLVGPGGATHEALLVSEVLPSLVNTALLTLGVDQGRNVLWVPRDPPLTEEEREAGVDPYDLVLPEGDGFYLYLAWREGAERFLFRMEDLLANLSSGRTMRRHRFVYLGSRFGQLEGGGPEVFLADSEQNLINLAFFHQGTTLLTSALEECADQTIWLANAWIVPPSGSPVWLVLAREPVADLSGEWWEEIAELVVTDGERAGDR